MAKHALIGGGTGFIGSRLTRHLRQNGYNTTIVSRMPGLKRITWHELEQNGIPNDVTTVINVAGQNVLDPTRRWTEGFKQNVWNSRINSTSALVNAIRNSPTVKSFVNLSGVSNYRPIDTKVYNEDDKVEAFDYMSELCVEWEKAANLPLDVKEYCRGVKIRTGVVVGRGGGIVQSMGLPFKLGLGGPIGSGKQTLPWIHMDDLCRLIQHCIETEYCEGIYNGVAPQIITNGQFSKTFAEALNRPCLFAVPEFVIQTIYGKDRSALLLTGAKIHPKRTIDSGFEYSYPCVSSACAEVVQ